jgi:hypothetical protein
MSKAIRNEIEKATFLDGKGKKIIRIGEGLDKDYGSHCDDRNVMCFFKNRWLPSLRTMNTASEVEKQIENFFNTIPSLSGTEEERKIMGQLRELGLGRKMVSAPVVASAMMNNTRLNDFNNNNGMFNNEGKLVYLPNNNSNATSAKNKGGRRRKTKKRIIYKSKATKKNNAKYIKKKKSKKNYKYPLAREHLFYLNRKSRGKRITAKIIRKYPKAFNAKLRKRFL